MKDEMKQKFNDNIFKNNELQKILPIQTHIVSKQRWKMDDFLG